MIIEFCICAHYKFHILTVSNSKQQKTRRKNMEIIAKISKNDYLTGIRVFEKGDAVSREEIVEAVNKAAEAAEDDGFRGTYVDLPEKYLEI